MKNYKHLFFDFDNTLWDFNKNSKDSLYDIFVMYKFADYFVDFEDFYQKYEENNTKLWIEYRNGLISKEVLSIRRFSEILEKAAYPELGIARKINSDYLAQTTTKTKTIDDAYELLNYLKNKYEINIITDGFFEVQVVKLRTSKLSPFINNIITAEEIGFLKPSKKLFEYALESVEATIENSIMIGDTYETDILGAYNAGIDQIFLNNENKTEFDIKPTYVVKSLKEIKAIL
jgi:putative hydrolase of the HAD superfamily